ncbi:MAG: COG1361 S-layer family protein [Candidatus Nanosalina sp.]
MKKLATALLALTLLSGAATAQKSVQLEVKKVNMEPVPLQTSEYADVWLEVVNKGSTAAQDAEINFTENYPFSVDPGEQTHWNLGELVPGEEYMIHLQTRVDENAVQGENNLKFRISSGGVSFTQKVPVEVRSDSDLLAISEVEFPQNVAPGTSKRINLTLENLADGQVKNIEVKLDLSKVPVATSGTTSRAVTKITSDASSEVSFQLNVDESAENGVYRVPVTLEYENEAGTTFTRETTVGVVVGGEPQLEAGLNSVENRMTPGSTGTVTFRLVNKGRGSADFVEFSVPESEKYQVLSPSSVYMGGMDPDDYQTAEYQIHVSSDTEQLSIPVEITYQTPRGEKTITQKVKLPVYTSQELKSYGLVSGGSPLPIIVVILVLAGGVYYWRRRKSKRD